MHGYCRMLMLLLRPLLLYYFYGCVDCSIKCFKFFNMCTLHDNFLNLVSNLWAHNIDGYAQYVLKQKLNRLKKPLQRLNRKHFSHISNRAKVANDELVAEKQVVLSGGVSLKDVKSLRRKAELLLEAEQLFFAQKIKSDFLNLGDRCSKFFHNLIKRNNKRNSIIALTKRDRIVTTVKEEIASEFVDYYKLLLGSSTARSRLDSRRLGAGNFVTADKKLQLVAPISFEEVKNALFDIDDGKSPGPDGFSSLFFKKAWDVVWCDVVEVFSEFFRTGKLLKQWSHAFIALVPKSADANSVADYRPISCCNVFYKIISKILASRICSVIGDLVDPAQAAYISDRSIVDNVHLAQELFRNYNRKSTSARCILKVDLQKAYDTLNWDFLDEALRFLEFPDIFIGWIMECVSTTAFSISINGQLHGFFHGRRGLRQGDPLSPYLFTICLEMLSRSLKFASSSPDFNFHPKCQPLCITHLAYTGDLLLLSRGGVGSVSILTQCLHDFSATAGLRANILKSNLFLAGVSDSLKNEILQLTGFQMGDFPFRYLGIPIAAIKLKISEY